MNQKTESQFKIDPRDPNNDTGEHGAEHNDAEHDKEINNPDHDHWDKEHGGDIPDKDNDAGN